VSFECACGEMNVDAKDGSKNDYERSSNNYTKGCGWISF
jgi:hypothetical protein